MEARILQQLQEQNFQALPAAVLQDVQTIFGSEVSAGIVENAFKELRAKETGFETDFFQLKLFDNSIF